MVDDDFVGLLEGARVGDEQAIGRLLGEFESEVRLMVRAQLPRALRGQFDSMDFVQAVWQSVFTGAEMEPDRFANARHFRGFLAGVARNKVKEEYRRRTQTRKYDLGREERLYVRKGDHDEPRSVAARDPSPSAQVQADDFLERLIAGRTARDAEVVELRRQGLTVVEVAERLGIHERSVRRVIDDLRGRLESRLS